MATGINQVRQMPVRGMPKTPSQIQADREVDMEEQEEKGHLMGLVLLAHRDSRLEMPQTR
jgi:hypothetical protein